MLSGVSAVALSHRTSDKSTRPPTAYPHCTDGAHTALTAPYRLDGIFVSDLPVASSPSSIA